jgi:RNA polymerase sigma factor (sigma-70 family)
MNRIQEVEDWYKANASNIKKMASKRSKQDAEDILQDTAIKLLTNPAKWEAISKQDTTRRAMWRFYNPTGGYKGYSEARLVPMDELKQEASPETLTEALFTKRSVELVTELVNSLSGASKSIFEMHFFQDMDYVEISEKLNMDHKSVKSLGYYAKEIVKNKFNEIVR